MTRLQILEAELIDIKKTIGYYLKLCKGNQQSFNINEVLKREHKVYIKINQQKQKSTINNLKQ